MYDLPNNYKFIINNWIFKKKLRPNNTIDKYKVKFVIRNFNQKKSVDCFDIHFYVTKIAIIGILIALVIRNLVVH